MLVQRAPWLAALVTLAACDRDSPESPKPDDARPTAVAPSSKPGEGEGVIYAVAIRPAGDYVVGKPAKVEAVLDAKGEYKCNADYPYKFKLADPPEGVSYPDKVAKGVERTEARAVLSIPFTPTSAGDKEIRGTFHFSVCNKETCKIDKKEMSIKVTVVQS